MKTLVKITLAFLQSEDGPTVTEYGVMLALIIVGCFVVIASIGGKTRAAFLNLESGLPEGS